MVKSVFKIPESHVNLQRNAFDVSNIELLSQSLGQLLPVFVREVNPNEHVRINTELYSRTQPLNSAAFVNIKQNVEFFFVPFRLLWSRSQQFFPKTDYGTTTALSPYAPERTPTISLSRIANAINYVHRGGTPDLLGYKISYGMVRLLDMLGYGDFSEYLTTDEKSATSTYKPNLFRILAYQKIYQDFYRNEVLESQNLNTYNVDSLFEASSSGEIYSSEDPSVTAAISGILQLRYRNLRSDYFTCGRTNFTGASWMSSSVNPLVLPNSGSSIVSNPYSNNSSSGYQGNIIGSVSNNLYGFSIANLRSAYALDKLYDSMSRAKDGCYAHQVEARFGITPNLDDYHSRYLGGTDSHVQIGEVIGTSGDNLGDIGGKGTSYSNDGHTIDFDVEEHGIIMGIQSFMISSDYMANGLERMNSKTRFEDYLQPEFSDLGYQPIYNYELESPINNGSSTSPNGVFSYVPRYSEYKTSFNRVHGNFRKNKSMSMWSAPIDLTDPFYASSINFAKIKTNPSLLDSIFTVNFDGSVDTDQFVCRNSFNCQIIRPISVYGSPYLK